MELRRALAIKAKGRVALGSKFFYSCWLHFCSKERLPQFLRHSCLLMGFVTPREESHFSSFYVMQMWSTLELSSAISFVKLSLAWVGSSTAKHYEFFKFLSKHLRGLFRLPQTEIQELQETVHLQSKPNGFNTWALSHLALCQTQLGMSWLIHRPSKSF